MSIFPTYLASVMLLLRLGSAQVVGRYALETKDYHMAFNVSEKYLVYFEFQCLDAAGRPMMELFSDGPYNLTYNHSSRSYQIDFENTFEGIANWYNAIRLGCQPSISPRKGDLTSLATFGSDHVYTVFLGKAISLGRVALELSPGSFRFPYKNASSFDGIIIDYTVGHDSTVVMQVVCSGITTNFWTFPLVRNEKHFGFPAYFVDDGSRSVTQFQDSVRRVYPGYAVHPGDYRYLIFATRSTVLTVAGNTRLRYSDFNISRAVHAYNQQ